MSVKCNAAVKWDIFFTMVSFCFADGRHKRFLRLSFLCGGKGDQCLYSKSYFTLDTKLPKPWIHLMFLSTQVKLDPERHIDKKKWFADENRCSFTQTCRHFNHFKLVCEAMPLCSLLISFILSDPLNHSSICDFVIVLSFSGQGGLSPESAWLQHQSPEDLLGLPPDWPHGGELPHPGYLLLPLSQGQNQRLRVRQRSMSSICVSSGKTGFTLLQTYLQHDWPSIIVQV